MKRSIIEINEEKCNGLCHQDNPLSHRAQMSHGCHVIFDNGKNKNKSETLDKT